MNKSFAYKDLLNVLRKSQGKEPQTLISECWSCLIPLDLKEGICEAVQGDNRLLNKWLFSKENDYETSLAWIAPVKSRGHSYAWMVGKVNKSACEVHEWFQDALTGIKQDPLLNQDHFPAQLLFVDTEEVSSVSTGEFGYEDEFAIFQVGYRDVPVEVSDFDQRMVINTSHALSKRQEAFRRLIKLSDLDSEGGLATCLQQNLELFSIIHNEGHNMGHYVGAWPYEEEVKRQSVMYEVVEEFKACLASIALCNHLPLSELEKDAFAVSVFMSRFLGYGYDAFKLESQKRETAREITVGLMFFEWLLREEVIEIPESGKIKLTANKVRSSLMQAYIEIFEFEKSVAKTSIDKLGPYGRSWYSLAFPDGNYSQYSLNVYNRI